MQPCSRGIQSIYSQMGAWDPIYCSREEDVDPCTTVRGVMGWSRGVLVLHNATAETLMLCGLGRLWH